VYAYTTFGGNIKKNFRKHYKVLRKIFFAMANTYTTEEFNQYMAETYSIDKRVKKYLFEICIQFMIKVNVI